MPSETLNLDDLDNSLYMAHAQDGATKETNYGGAGETQATYELQDWENQVAADGVPGYDRNYAYAMTYHNFDTTGSSSATARFELDGKYDARMAAFSGDARIRVWVWLYSFDSSSYVVEREIIDETTTFGDWSHYKNSWEDKFYYKLDTNSSYSVGHAVQVWAASTGPEYSVADCHRSGDFDGFSECWWADVYVDDT